MKDVDGRLIGAMLHPRLAVLLTCCDEAGRPDIATIAWHTPLSHDPPLVGVALRTGSYSQRSIGTTGEFVINVVGADFLEAIDVCGNISGEKVDKLALAGVATHPANMVKPPLLTGALGYLECRVDNSLVTGDHVFIVGRVLHAEARVDCFSNAWEPSEDGALLCLQRDRFGRYIDIQE